MNDLVDYFVGIFVYQLNEEPQRGGEIDYQEILSLSCVKIAIKLFICSNKVNCCNNR